MVKSLEFNWIHRMDKWLRVPEIVFDESTKNVGGYYRHPEHGELFVDNRFIPCDNGVIVVHQGAEETIAHEWRHHWQYCSGYPYDGVGWKNTDDYDKELRNYFASSIMELDAVRFQLKYSNADYHDEWKRILQGIL